MAAATKTIYVIRICDFPNLFDELSIDSTITDVNTLITNIAVNNKSQQHLLYRLEDGREKLCQSPITINDGDIFTLRSFVSNHFVGAMQYYTDLKHNIEQPAPLPKNPTQKEQLKYEDAINTATQLTKINNLFDRMVAEGLPYYVEAKGDGACFYYSFIYGLFMTSLLRDTTVDNINKYFQILKEGINNFVNNKQNENDFLKYYTSGYENKLTTELDKIQEFFNKIYDDKLQPNIKRLMFDSLVNSFPVVMESFRFAQKCTWLSFLQNIDSNNDPVFLKFKDFYHKDEYIYDIENILPKFKNAEGYIIEFFPYLFNEFAPKHVHERYLIRKTEQDKNDYFQDFKNENFKKAFAFMAYTGVHYDIALKSDFKYKTDEIVSHIKNETSLSSASSSASASASVATSLNLTENELNAQQIELEKFEEERNTKIENAAKKLRRWSDDDLNALASEPGIDYLVDNQILFDENSKNLRKALLNFIINKGSVGLLQHIDFKHELAQPALKKEEIYKNVATPSSKNKHVELAYLYAINPTLYMENKDNDINVINSVIQTASAPPAATTSTANPVTNTSSNTASTAVATNTVTNAASNPAANPAANTVTNTSSTTVVNPVATTQYTAWAKLSVDGKVTEVLFERPQSGQVLTLNAWKNKNPAVEAYIILNFTLNNFGLAENLDFSQSVAQTTNIDTALTQLYKPLHL